MLFENPAGIATAACGQDCYGRLRPEAEADDWRLSGGNQGNQPRWRTLVAGPAFERLLL